MKTLDELKKLLDEQLNDLCCEPPLSYDEFMERKQRILWYCFDSMDNKAKNLAEEHWKYVKTVILNSEPNINTKIVDIIGFHYITAFVHGYKHGKEDVIK